MKNPEENGTEKFTVISENSGRKRIKKRKVVGILKDMGKKRKTGYFPALATWTKGVVIAGYRALAR